MQEHRRHRHDECDAQQDDADPFGEDRGQRGYEHQDHRKRRAASGHHARGLPPDDRAEEIHQHVGIHVERRQQKLRVEYANRERPHCDLRAEQVSGSQPSQP